MSYLPTAATPIKLRNGDWGVRVIHSAVNAPNPGDEITVTALSGQRWQTTVDNVVWFDDIYPGSAKMTLVSTKTS